MRGAPYRSVIVYVLVQALYDFQASHEDVQLLNAWLVVMEAAHHRLLDFDFDVGVAHLPKLFSCSVSCFMTTASFVKETAASLLEVRDRAILMCVYKTRSK